MCNYINLNDDKNSREIQGKVHHNNLPRLKETREDPQLSPLSLSLAKKPSLHASENNFLTTEGEEGLVFLFWPYEPFSVGASAFGVSLPKKSKKEERQSKVRNT